MTRDEIISMAREAGFQTGRRDHMNGEGGCEFVTPVSVVSCLHEIERFAALVAARTAAEERKVIEEICEEFGAWNKTASEILDALYDRDDRAIRARGQEVTG